MVSAWPRWIRRDGSVDRKTGVRPHVVARGYVAGVAMGCSRPIRTRSSVSRGYAQPDNFAWQRPFPALIAASGDAAVG